MTVEHRGFLFSHTEDATAEHWEQLDAWIDWVETLSPEEQAEARKGNGFLVSEEFREELLKIKLPGMRTREQMRNPWGWL